MHRMVAITEVKSSVWEECLRSFIIRKNDTEDEDKEISCVVDIIEGKDIEKEVDKILATKKIDLPFRLNVCKKVWGTKPKVILFLILVFLSWLMLLRMVVKGETVLKLIVPIFAWLTLYGLFILTICLNWYRVVRGNTHHRSNPKCASNKRFPGMQINGNLENRFDEVEKIEDYDSNVGMTTDEYVGGANGRNTTDEYVGGVKYGVYEERPFPIDVHGKYLKKMSHQHLSLWEDLYVSLLLYPGAIFQLFFGNKYQGGLTQFLYIRFKDFLKNEDENKHVEKQSTVLFDVILESTLSSMIEDLKTSDTNELEGVLVIPGSTNFTENKEILVGTLRVGLNITKRRISFCTFDEKSICVSEALAISAVALAGIVHPVIHCYSNWGTCSEILSSSFLKLMSLLTIKYNHMGNRFGNFSGVARKLGITRHVGYEEGTAAVHHGVHSLKFCPNLKLLQNHSTFVDFMIKTKEVFVREFKKYKEDFPGIECEGMFQGTVIHSIDHANTAFYLKLSDFSPSPNSEMARLILCCFAEKPPSLVETRFSKAPHPLYRNVYAFASKIDKRLADVMECCIDM